jgi:hypothetical protein
MFKSYMMKPNTKTNVLFSSVMAKGKNLIHTG